MLRFQRFRVHLWALAEILLRVGEEIVRTRTCNVGATYFRIGKGELCRSGRDPIAHQLLLSEGIAESVSRAAQ